MKLKISLAILNGVGSCAHLENADDDHLEIARLRTDGAGVKTCMQAAKALRAAADKFEALAKCEDIYKATTQERINGMREQ